MVGQIGWADSASNRITSFSLIFPFLLHDLKYAEKVTHGELTVVFTCNDTYLFKFMVQI